MTRIYFSLGGLLMTAALGMSMIAPKAPDNSEEQITANTWVGKLVDWRCKQLHSDTPCPVNSKTEDMGISVDGGVLLDLDTDGDAMARETLKKAGAGGNVKVTIKGVREGRKLTVKSIEIGGPKREPIS